MEEFFKRNCCIQGYLVYKEVWKTAVGEALVYEREPENASNQYAVSVKKERTIIRYLSRKLSRMYFLFFFALGGTIECTVTGHKKYSDDLAQAQARA